MLLENTDLENHPRIRKPFWESRIPRKQFYHTPGAENTKLDILEKTRETVGLHLHYLTSKIVQLGASEPFSARDSSHRGQWEHVNECVRVCCFTAVHDTTKETHFSFTSSRILIHEHSSQDSEHSRLKGSRSHSLCQELHRGPCPQFTVDTHPQWPTDTPSTACTSLTLSIPPYEQFPLHSPNGGKSKILQTASEHMQKAGLNLRAWRRMPLWKQKRLSAHGPAVLKIASSICKMFYASLTNKHKANP